MGLVSSDDQTLQARRGAFGEYTWFYASAIGACLLIDALAVAVGPTAGLAVCYLAVPMVLLWVRQDYWPALAVLQIVLVPVSYMSSIQSVSFLPPSLILIVCYLARKSVWVWRPTEIHIWLALLVYALALVLVGRSVDLSRKVVWLGLLVILAVSAFTVVSRRTTESALTALCISGGLAACFAIVESLTEYNPLSSVYTTGALSLEQKWETYRVLSTIGHPLVNGTVYALAFFVCLVRFTSRPGVRYSLLMLLLVAGCALTASRSGALAIVVSTAACGLGFVVQRKWTQAFTTVLVCCVGIVSYYVVDTPLQARSLSAEGQGSALLRDRYLRSFGDLMGVTDYLGTGLGASSRALNSMSGFISKYPIESSLIQLAVGLGVVGVTLLFVAVGCAVRRWMVAGSMIGPGLLVAYGTAASGYNLLEAYPALFALVPIIFIIGNGASMARHPVASADELGGRSAC